MFTVITENDESKWNDITGKKYHFPKRYIHFLQPETTVVYYKGRMTKKLFSANRLSHDPHYFGIATIDKIEIETGTTNYYATLKDYTPFVDAVPFKKNAKYLEAIPNGQELNYWRSGVRPINEKIYNAIVLLSHIIGVDTKDQAANELVTTIYQEGGKKKIYTTIYERDKNARKDAIAVHGYVCQVCDFDFKETYGFLGEGYIHVHHKNPLSSSKERIPINPETDLTVVCANCHSMIHRKKDTVLKIEELRKLVEERRKK